MPVPARADVATAPCFKCSGWNWNVWPLLPAGFCSAICVCMVCDPPWAVETVLLVPCVPPVKWINWWALRGVAVVPPPLPTVSEVSADICWLVSTWRKKWKNSIHKKGLWFWKNIKPNFCTMNIVCRMWTEIKDPKTVNSFYIFCAHIHKSSHWHNSMLCLHWMARLQECIYSAWTENNGRKETTVSLKSSFDMNYYP